jgi:transposase-like protein
MDSEEKFLAALSGTANVRAAAREAGVSAVTAYNRRRQWPAFAAAWDAAKAEGYVRIEMLLIDAATNTLDPAAAAEAARAEGHAPPEMSVEQAMKLWFHRAGQGGGKARRYGWRLQEPDIEEVRADLLRKVAAIAKARELAGRE